MSIIFEPDVNRDNLMEVARGMVMAARTAPKGRGEDNTVLAIVEGDDIRRISDHMLELAKKYEHPGFERDGKSILAAPVMVLFASRIKPMGLKKCGMCGFENCAAKAGHPLIPCAFNTGDLGIAIGSAVSVAADRRADCRIMYTVGIAVMDMGLLGPGVRICYAAPLSATSKNPFFDRK